MIPYQLSRACFSYDTDSARLSRGPYTGGLVAQGRASTSRGASVLVAFPLFWALETALVGWAACLRWAFAFFLSPPLGGLIAYRYLVGTGRLRHQLSFGSLLLTRAQEASRLLAEHREIVEELERAKRDYLGGAKGPSV
jgi:hypothetical protein